MIEPLPKDAVNDGNLVDIEGIAEALRRGWKRLGSPIRSVAIAIPTPMAIYKKLLVPASQTEDMDELIESEANQIIPFPLDEVNLDHQVLGRRRPAWTIWKCCCAPRARKKWRSGWRWWRWPACARTWWTWSRSR
ncbi:type IV pilus assembly protein PilM [Chromobacterium violaceum]|uniref:Type IV pilus assembly protein PilM n=1 Tax=Chromobacterium violaceum TaxID=536 RepID=A0A3S4LEZ4_CHRVL|nr:type IV pilus assembly protein PilM [Chromobacterium violaceum]